MHELSIAQSVVEMACEVAEREGAQAVSAIFLKLGPLSCVVEEALRFAFEVAAAGTAAAEARLEVEAVPVRIHCHPCGLASELESLQHFVCARCGRPSAEIVAGRELLVTRLELEEQVATC